LFAVTSESGPSGKRHPSSWSKNGDKTQNMPSNESRDDRKGVKVRGNRQPVK